jgi:DNA-binding ferritin-like protein (Dps family)
MAIIIEKIIGVKADKKKYREYMRRAKQLPKDYRAVFKEIKRYIWGAGGALDGSVDELYAIIELFEQAAADGKKVLDITGENVASFCDELLRDSKTWQDEMRRKLNKNVKEKLSKERK